MDASNAAREAAPAKKPELRSMGQAELAALVESLGERGFRAKQLFRWIHARGARDFDEMSDLSKGFRETLKAKTELSSLQAATIERAKDGTRKYAFRTARGDIIESVFIPDASAEGRNTLCISSQVGCALDCKFCLTATLGLRRNLSSGEIVEQLSRVKEDLAKGPEGPLPEPPRIHNVVMMGMGEPLHNYENLIRALSIMTSEDGHGMSSRRITVSTSGLAPRIPRLGRDSAVNLAVSLNATTDEVRDRIMPINKRYNIQALLDACREFPLPERRRITFEYVMLEGVNDSLDDARRLVGLLHGFRCKVNLIPFNEHPRSPFKQPSPAVVDAFRALLIDRGMSVFVRTSRGEDISAACGQLGVEVDRV
ncbi:MAG: 23S rRNA (adenine(2503)-C(2))-methyltransferase RlmN [Myxococcota bacterium]